MLRGIVIFILTICAWDISIGQETSSVSFHPTSEWLTAQANMRMIKASMANGDTNSNLPLLTTCLIEGIPTPESSKCAEMKMLSFIEENLEYPLEAKSNHIEGMVITTFIVRSDGSIEEIAIVKDLGSGCGTAAIKVIEKMSKLYCNWLPASMNGEAKDCIYTLPVRFEL